MPTTSGNPLRKQWDVLSSLPGGKLFFSRAVSTLAPYTGTISPRVIELRPGYAEVTMRDRRQVRNHLRSIHAVAIVNLAELTANLALLYSLPTEMRMIVTGLSIEYVKKARGTLTATCQCGDIPPSTESSDRQVEVVVRDPAGEVVARAEARLRVGPKEA